jgi:Transport protein particle (TRAPP) component
MNIVIMSVTVRWILCEMCTQGVLTLVFVYSLYPHLAPLQQYSTFVSVPSDLGGLSVDAYLSGIIAGLLEGAGFPARVTAHSVALEEDEGGQSSNPANPGGSSGSNAVLTGSLPPRKEKTVFLVKFHKSVLAREAAMS